MTDDVAALMEHLGIEQADIVGYSMGGSVALQVAIRHPDRVRKLVSASGPYRLDGLYPEVIAGIAEFTLKMMLETPGIWTTPPWHPTRRTSQHSSKN